jgi:hypothetical protein
MDSGKIMGKTNDLLEAMPMRGWPYQSPTEKLARKMTHDGDGQNPGDLGRGEGEYGSNQWPKWGETLSDELRTIAIKKATCQKFGPTTVGSLKPFGR